MTLKNDKAYRANVREIQRLNAKLIDPAQSCNGATVAAFDRRVAADRLYLGLRRKIG
jgi:hypothetical protein